MLGVKGIRLLLLQEPMPIDEITDSGILKRLCNLIEDPQTLEKSKIEIAWIFTNLSTGACD